MKPTAKNIAAYVNKSMDRSGIDNVSVCLPKLPAVTLAALRNNYNFTTVQREFMGYIHFERQAVSK